MKKLIFKFWGQASWYNFVADITENTVSYKTTSLNVGPEKEGTLESDEAKKFVEDLKNAHIEDWYSQYEPSEQLIMDAGNYSICYVDDENDIYFTNCDDACLPENFAYLTEALGICDIDAARYFDSNSLGED